jgi:hypothetical protein
MFKYLMGTLFLGSLFVLSLSLSKKDYQNCSKLHGEEFAESRKKKMKIFGFLLLLITVVSLILDFMMV